MKKQGLPPRGMNQVGILALLSAGMMGIFLLLGELAVEGLDERLDQLGLANRITINNQEYRLFGTDHQALGEFVKHLCNDRAVVQYEAELAVLTHRRIMLNEKRRPVTSTTGVSPTGAHVVPV